VLTQAMAMGVPVVATSAGGIPEIVTHEESGMLAPVNNVEALTNYIRAVLKNASLRSRIVAQAKDRIAQSYSLDAMLDAVEQFYSEVIQKCHNPQVSQEAIS